MKREDKERNLPEISIKQLMSVGAHFGHKRWFLNAHAAKYVLTERNNLSIIDLNQTLPLLREALAKLYDVGSEHGKILFVGTRRHISGLVKESAKRCAQFYIHHRWLGGLLTNWSTISKSINKLKDLEKNFEQDIQGLTKKEVAYLEAKKQKMKLVFDGIRTMNGLPDLIVVLDVANRGGIAIQEASQKKIPVIGLIDTNCNPELVNYPIPINDDSINCMKYILDLFIKSVLLGVRDKVEDTTMLPLEQDTVETMQAETVKLEASAELEDMSVSLNQDDSIALGSEQVSS